MPREQHQPEVHSITGARTSLNDDLSQRMRRYLVSMSVRTLCFILAVAFHGPLRWVFAVLAIVLPYVAVVAANAGPRRSAGHRGYVPPKPVIEGNQAGRLEK